jgi:hypothetical protein
MSTIFSSQTLLVPGSIVLFFCNKQTTASDSVHSGHVTVMSEVSMSDVFLSNLLCGSYVRCWLLGME